MVPVMTGLIAAFSPDLALSPLNYSVDYQSLSTKIARLRAELHEMGRANRKYFQKKWHSREERDSHLLRQERIQQIKAELEAMSGREGI